MENITPSPTTYTEQIHYAGFWRRFAAYLIDVALLNIALTPFTILFFHYSGLWDFIMVMAKTPKSIMNFIGVNDAFNAILLQNVFKEVLYLALWQCLFVLLYYTLFESSKLQATPGKLAVRIKVSSSGERISFGRALARNLSKLISGFILMIGYMMAGWTAKKQALHDIIADCTVELSESSVGSAVPFEYAGFWRRFVAWVLDTILIFIVLSPIDYIFLPAYYRNFSVNIIKSMRSGENIPIPSMSEMGQISVITIFSAVLVYLYFATWESSRQQATPGKLAIGIKVTDIHGQRLSFWRASARYVNKKYVTALTLLIGYMMAGWTARKQALHDKLSNCLVVSSSPMQVPHQTPSQG